MTPRSPAVLPCPTCVSVHNPIKSTYLIHKANFVACHNPSYVRKYNMVQELVDGGTFLLNCPWDMEGLEKHLPGQVKKFIADHNIKFYTIDGVKTRYRDRYGTDPYQHHPSVRILQTD